MRDITWTQHGPALWTGRLDDRPAGTIELGSRFTYVDVDGTRHTGFRTLADAQAAVDEGPVHCRRRARVISYLLPLLVLVICLAVAVAAVFISRG